MFPAQRPASGPLVQWKCSAVSNEFEIYNPSPPARTSRLPSSRSVTRQFGQRLANAIDHPIPFPRLLLTKQPHQSTASTSRPAGDVRRPTPSPCRTASPEDFLVLNSRGIAIYLRRARSTSGAICLSTTRHTTIINVNCPAPMEIVMSRTKTELERKSPKSKSTTRARPAISRHVQTWIDQCIDLCQPDDVFWCDGSPEEKQTLINRGVKEKVLIELNQQKLPGCYLHRSNPNDVARTEQCTFICTPSAGHGRRRPTTGWKPGRLRQARGAVRRLHERAGRCMSCPSSWDRSARRWPRSACSSPIRSTSPSAWAS